MSISFNNIQKQPVQLYDKKNCSHCWQAPMAQYCVGAPGKCEKPNYHVIGRHKTNGPLCGGWFAKCKYANTYAPYTYDDKCYDALKKQGREHQDCPTGRKGCCSAVCKKYCK